MSACAQSSTNKIGLIGGMGSSATIATYRQIIKVARRRHLAPHLLVNNLPRENIFDRLGHDLPTMICRGVADLATAGAKVVGISCNTAHIYHHRIRETAQAQQIDFVNLIDEVAAHCCAKGLQAVGVLATPTGTDLYREALTRCGITPVIPTPDEQDNLNTMIRQILSEVVASDMAQSLHNTAESLLDRHAEAVILGCTELPLAFGSHEIRSPYICSISILANSLVAAAYRKEENLGSLE